MTLRNSLVYSSPLCTQAEVEACILNIATCQETKKQGSPFTDFNSQQFVTLECTKSTRHLSTKATTHTQKGHFSLLNITNTCCKRAITHATFSKWQKRSCCTWEDLPILCQQGWSHPELTVRARRELFGLVGLLNERFESVVCSSSLQVCHFSRLDSVL